MFAHAGGIQVLSGKRQTEAKSPVNLKRDWHTGTVWKTADRSKITSKLKKKHAYTCKWHTGTVWKTADRSKITSKLKKRYAHTCKWHTGTVWKTADRSKITSKLKK
ncbi:hypothetical protein Avbf_13105 [Armadillidium vulgare]|nr:hypothetical protein Avbf_13105 [Armadillidium vulgare]